MIANRWNFLIHVLIQTVSQLQVDSRKFLVTLAQSFNFFSEIFHYDKGTWSLCMSSLQKVHLNLVLDMFLSSIRIEY